MRHCRLWELLAVLLIMGLGTTSARADVTVADEYNKRLKNHQTISPGGATPFGEQINLYTGEVSFHQTDVVVPGIGPSIVLARSTATSQDDVSTDPLAFGNWTLSVPRIETLLKAQTATPGGNWQVGIPATSARCTQFDAPTLASFKWWHGFTFIDGRGGRQPVLQRSTENTHQPTMTGANGQPMVFPAVTARHWQFGCLPTTSNGQAGEAFLAVAPDGTRYWLDHLVQRPAETVEIYIAHGVRKIKRVFATMAVTRIEDRFGNWVHYHYSGQQLTSITASDGRAVAINWRSDTPVIEAITVHPGTSAARTWHYAYVGGRLSSVVLPDGKHWQFSGNLGALTMNYAEKLGWCSTRDSSGLPVFPAALATITSPTGLVGRFTMQATWHARSYVTSACLPGNEEGVPPVFGAYSLVGRKFSGPGMATQTWTYDYSPAQGSTLRDLCAANDSCPETAWVDIHSPAGHRTRHTFSTRWGASEGKSVRIDRYQNGSVLLRSETFGYAASAQGPWPARIGILLSDYGTNTARLQTLTPLLKRTITQQGETFTAQVQSFDSFARPLQVAKWSSVMAYGKTDTTVYHDDLDLWVLGQVKSSTTAKTGTSIQVARTDYDATTALPIRRYAFGKLQHTLTYHADGTLATVKDGRNLVTTLSSWYRGVPRSIVYADGTSKTATVNATGTIASTTDENGFTTGYAYDAMGRLTRIDYPTGDTTTWNDTTISFAPVASAEYGIAAGHWRQTISTGNGRKIVYYDAMWRPLLTREYDAGNVVATRRLVRHAYDASGRTAFTSYPSTSSSPTTGVHTDYDALGRVTQVQQDSELGPLTTTTQYLTGFKTRITNPRGYQATTQHYQVYDQPSTALPTDIYHPEGARTLFGRDVFGKPVSITRRNASNSTNLTRRYVYDAHQQLCKTIEPETASTVMAYDAAGNLAWSAAGQALPSSTACNTANVPLAARTTRSYDARNRVTALSFPDGLGDTTTSYTPDGLPTAITAHNGVDTVTTRYSYNKRRLLESERMQWNTINWLVDYGYNGNGHLAAQNAFGVNVVFAPNALGQATQAGSYATGASYYPNGALKQFTYGNGIVHTLTQNARGLPERSRDAYGSTEVLDDYYDFDGNGNVAAITDARSGSGQRGNRTMTYDGLDRLTDVTSPMYGSAGAHYSYDVLDNLTSVVAPGRNHTYHYDANNRLTTVKSGSATVIDLGYDVQGNVTNKNGALYDFDYGNRLRGVTGIASYVYDGLGRRVRDYTTASKYSMYTRAGQLIFAGDARKSKHYHYVYLGGSLVGVLERDLTTYAYSVKYQHTDALGTPVAVTAANRVVLERSEYEPYGKVTNRPMHDGPGYTGHVEDAATGLVYMQARYYDPELQIFASVDPVGPLSNPFGQFHRYRYANWNPYRYYDPDGRQAANCGSDKPVPCAPGTPKTDEKPPPPPEKPLVETIKQGAEKAWDGFVNKVLPAIPGEGVAVGLGGKFLTAAFIGKTSRLSGPVFRTTKAAAQAAQQLGFKKIKATAHGGQAVFKRGKLFITRDLDGHNGGAWKVADSVRGLESKASRIGTFDATLTTRVGN